MKQPIRIAIHLEGGIIEAVYTDASEVSIPIEVLIMDFDTEGNEEYEIAKPKNRDEFIPIESDACWNPELINEVWDAANEVWDSE